MNRKEKIEFLNNLQKGTAQLKDLKIIQDALIVDENDNRLIIKAAKENGNRIILSEDYERLEADGLVKGFVIDMRESGPKMLHYS